MAVVARTVGPLVVAHPLVELVAPIGTARGMRNPVSLMAGTSPGSFPTVGRGWALEGDQNCKTIQTGQPSTTHQYAEDGGLNAQSGTTPAPWRSG